MEPEVNSWQNDSINLMKNPLMNGTYDDLFINKDNFDFNSYKMPPLDVPTSNSNEENIKPNDNNIFDVNYYEIDNLLTQELQDLDIPMIPSPKSRNADINNNWDNTQEKKSTAVSHKRGLSGTAIFGFANHNKTLSITSLQRTMMTNSKDSDLMKLVNSSTTPDTAVRDQVKPNIQTNTNDINIAILKQQEELRKALEQQKEVNRKLEEQLLANQLQQKNIQRALEEQAINQSQLINQLPSNVRTPSHRNTPDEAIIITSNSANGRYQFPPPAMISPPMSSSSMNGSPTRRRSKNRLPQSDDDFSLRISPSRQDHLSPESDISSNLISNLFEKMNDGKALMDPINSPALPFPSVGNKVSDSPGSYKFVPRRHGKKESIQSTVSTITQSIDDDDDDVDNECSRSPRITGLGIQMNNKNSSSNNDVNARYIVSTSQLPTIPGSVENTPVKPNHIPRIHTFQHTPLKANIHENKNYNYTTNPSPEQAQEAATNCNNNNNNNHNHINNIQYTPTSVPISDEMAATSMILTPQREKTVRQMPDIASDERNTSPMKITRKPTTLPRGSIDQYVKELPEKLFECLYPNCGKVFKRRYNIRSHIQTHLEDRPYHCDYEGCKKAFVRNHDLIRHKKSHAAKIYGCACGRRFTKEESLMIHRNRMICIGGKKYDNAIVKKSPKKHPSNCPSPVKATIDQDKYGYIANKIEDQLQTNLFSSNNNYSLIPPTVPTAPITNTANSSSSLSSSSMSSLLALSPSP